MPQLNSAACFVVLCAVVALFLLCGAPSASAASLPPVVASSKLLGNITDPNHTDENHDGGYSGLIGGVPVWLFDDTMGKSGFYSNYIAYGNVNKPLWLNGTTGKVAFPFTANELNFNNYWCSKNQCGQIRYAIWPNSSPVQVGTNAGALFSDRVYVNSSAKNKFSQVGTAAASLAVGPNIFPTLTRVGNESFWNTNQPGFGAYATLNVGDGYIYLYAYCSPLLFLARAPPATIFDKTTYQFFDGKGGWNTIVPARNDTSRNIMYDWVGSSTIFYSKYYSAYLMVYCQWDNVVRAKSAPNPWGPWTGSANLFNATRGPNGFTYSCAAHPEYSAASNQLYISFTYQGSAGYQNRVALLTFK